jgi:putative DNA primase/helicase
MIDLRDDSQPFDPGKLQVRDPEIAKTASKSAVIDFPDYASGPPTVEETKAEIARLAEVSVADYDRERQGAAARLKLRLKTLDILVAAQRPQKQEPALDRPLALDAVDGPELVRDLVADLSRYVSLGPEFAVATAFWALHTYALDYTFISPRLAITAPEPRCGKTTLIDWLETVAQRPMKSDNLTAAVAFHVVDEKRPSLLIDGADTFLATRDELRGILNSGHRRNGFVLRHDYRAGRTISYSTFSACAIAMLGDLPATLQDRSIRIRLRRRRADEKIDSLRAGRAGDELAQRCARWVSDNFDSLAVADPAVPPQLFNRTADNWLPLIAIADVIGGEWPETIRKVALKIVAADAGDDFTPGTRLLAEIREALGERKWISSSALAKSLSMSPKLLATKLRGYDVVPRQERRTTGPARGYRAEWFADAFARYLPPVPDVPEVPVEDVARAQPKRSGTSGTSGTKGRAAR